MSRIRGARGYSEESFSKALAIELRDAGFFVLEQVAQERFYGDECIGMEFVDLIVDKFINLEVEKASCIRQEYISRVL